MRSMPEILASKRDSLELTANDFQFICNNINDIPKEQLGAFLMACQINGLSSTETSNLTLAMLNAGEKMEKKSGRVDKHSTGGVGDKMSIILAPALRAAGAIIPMLAGRGLAHTGGTIDKLEAIPGFNTGLSLDEMKTKVPVLIISDGKTYIQLENNLDLGSFKSEKIMLDPGKYLIVGTRTGFYDVSKNFIISTDKKDIRVYIICEQKQRI